MNISILLLGECGQGWFQQTTSTAVADTLAPLLHWRICHVWDWLVQADVELGYPTFDIAEVYGHDPQDDLGETESINARTGCIGCPLVQEDAALERVLAKQTPSGCIWLRCGNCARCIGT
ncbi:hypothetical protein [Nodosilinea sp. LEGE 07088]|uniref:hypothetical protein n=1 Tax=Nodosilinea sp. LEGE 07088 TaxID=2777968 RepID=UPI001D152845|nr:hypothetical protein [Nodosilinea sp. LEGE 07088]